MGVVVKFLARASRATSRKPPQKILATPLLHNSNPWLSLRPAELHYTKFARSCFSTTIDLDAAIEFDFVKIAQIVK